MMSLEFPEDNHIMLSGDAVHLSTRAINWLEKFVNDLDRPQEKAEEKTSALLDDSPNFPPEKKQAAPGDYQHKFLKTEDNKPFFENPSNKVSIWKDQSGVWNAKFLKMEDHRVAF